MPAKCVLVEVLVCGVSLGVDPDKVATAVEWALEGAAVFPWKVQRVQGDESAEVSRAEPPAEILLRITQGR